MRSRILPFVWVILLTALPAAIYVWYVSGQRQRINELHQRELGRAAQNLEDVIDNAVRTVEENLIKKVRQKELSYPCQFASNQPYLAFPGGNCEDFNFEFSPGGPPALGPSGRGLELVVAEIGMREKKQKEGEKATPLAFEVRLGEILDELVVTDAFEYLFIADDRGKVVFQTRRGEGRRWDQQLRWHEQQARGRPTAPNEALRLRDVSELPLSAGGKAAFWELRTASSLAKVRLAGRDYQLFCQPMRLGRSGSWALGGLVPASLTMRLALAVTPQFILVLLLFLGLGLITWPLLKLFTLARRERFRFIDAYLLLGSTSALLIVATILLLDADTYRRFDEKAARGLEDLAEQVAANISKELSLIGEQLAVYDRYMEREGPRYVDCKELAQETHLLVPPDKRPPIQRRLPLPVPGKYANVRAVFWLRPDGLQIAKATIRQAATARVNVRERAYFREAAAGHLWSLNLDKTRFPERWPSDFFVQSYRSITTGEFETALSTPSGFRGCPDSPVIAVVNTDLHSIIEHALPSGYGFMVIDRGGSVLYHSDAKRALRENVFDEVSDPARLRATVFSGAGCRLSTAYRTRAHEFYVRPLKELIFETSAREHPERASELAGWFVISFRDLVIPRTVNGEAVISALLWCWVYLFFMQFLPALVFLAIEGRRAQWLWPNGAKRSLYRKLTIHLSLLLAATVSALVFLTGIAQLAVAWAAPVVVVVVAVWDCQSWRRKAEISEGVNRPRLARPAAWWHLSTAGLLWLQLAVLPAAGLFKFAWGQEFGRYLRHEALQLHQAREDLLIRSDDVTKRVERAYRGLPATPPRVDWSGHLKVYSFQPFDLLPTYPEKPREKELLDLADYKPVYNETTTWLRYHPSDAGLVGKADLGPSPGLFVAVGGLLLLGGLAFWIRYTADALFLSNVESQPLDFASVVAAIEKSQSNFFVIVNSAGETRRIQEVVERPAFRAAEVAAGLGPRPLSITAEPAGQASPGARAHFVNIDDALLEREARTTRLELERLVFKDGCRVVVVSRVDPFDSLAGGAVSAKSAPDHSDQPSVTEGEAESRRWCRLLEHFSVVPVGVSVKLLGAEARTSAEPDFAGQVGASHRVYWPLWTSCTDNEKLVLVHVAEEGFANPGQRPTVLGLLRRRLLTLQPDLQPFSPGFRRFIREVHDRRQIAQWERPVGTIGWGQVKKVLAGLLVAVALFLLSTQRESLTPAIGFVSTLAAALGGVLKLIGDLSRRGQPTDQ